MFKFIGNFICFVFWTLVYVFVFILEDNACINKLCYAVGFVGSIYILKFFWRMFFSPIKRDLLLMSGKFLKRVVCLVLFVPFVISSFSLIRDSRCGCTESSYDKISNLLIGDGKKMDATNKGNHVFWTVYYHFIDPGNQHMSIDKNGRGLAALIAVLGVLLLNGLLISTLINWFDNRKNLWAKGDIRYSRLAFRHLVFWRKKFAVVIGVDDNAATIIKNLLNGKGESDELDYVLVLTNFDVESVRSSLYSHLKDTDKEKVIIYHGQLDAFEQMDKLYLDKATEVYVLGEKQKDDEAYSYHDIQNMKIVHNIASDLTTKGVEPDAKKLVCHVLFEYQTTFSIFQFSDIPSKIKSYIDFIPFNNYEDWAQCVLVKGQYTEILKRVLPQERKMDLYNTMRNHLLYFGIKCLRGFLKKYNDEERTFDYLPLEGEKGIGVNDNKTVHFVVVGMSKMGIAMALQAAQIAHYPNFKPENGRRTRITFIDSNADSEKDFFIGRFQNMFNLTRYRYLDLSNGIDDLDKAWIDPIEGSSNYSQICTVGGKTSNFIDIEWEFVKGNLEQNNVRSYLKNIASEKDKVLTMAICFSLAHESIAAALYMPDEVYQSAQQIWVYQREASDMVANFTTNSNVKRSYEKIRPFGMSDAEFTTNKEYLYRAQLAAFVYDTIPYDEISEGNVDLDILKEDINSKILALINVSDQEKMEQVKDKVLLAWEKSSIANRWSNLYLANSFNSKLRCIGNSKLDVDFYYDIVYANIKVYEKLLAECEHNRWNVQQLLIGFRAYDNTELKKYLDIKGVDDKSTREERKSHKAEKKKGSQKAHVDICSFDKLNEVDDVVMTYDYIFNEAIPAILKVTKKERLLSKSKLKQKIKTIKKNEKC